MSSTPKVEGAKAAVIVGACRCGQAGHTDVRNGRKNVRMVDAMYEHECGDVGMWGCGDVRTAPDNLDGRIRFKFFEGEIFKV